LSYKKHKRHVHSPSLSPSDCDYILSPSSLLPHPPLPLDYLNSNFYFYSSLRGAITGTCGSSLPWCIPIIASFVVSIFSVWVVHSASRHTQSRLGDSARPLGFSAQFPVQASGPIGFISALTQTLKVVSINGSFVISSSCPFRISLFLHQHGVNREFAKRSSSRVTRSVMPKRRVSLHTHGIEKLNYRYQPFALKAAKLSRVVSSILRYLMPRTLVALLVSYTIAAVDGGSGCLLSAASSQFCQENRPIQKPHMGMTILARARK